MKGFLSSVRIVAFKEFEDCWRNLWLIVGSALFAFLSLAVVFGTAAIGGDFSFRPLEAVMTSVVTLGVFLIPLIAILILLPLNLLYVYALKDIPASMMSLITYVYPLIILAINGLIFHKSIRANQIVSITFILLGCLCIFSDAFKANITYTALGLGFLSTFMYAVYLLSLQQLATNVSAYQITFLTLLFSTIGLCFLHNPLFILRFDAMQLGTTFGYGVVSTVLSTICVSRAVQLLGATQAGIFCSFEPVFTIGFAALLLGESIPAFRLVGMVFLILGIVIPNRAAIFKIFEAKFIS